MTPKVSPPISSLRRHNSTTGSCQIGKYNILDTNAQVRFTNALMPHFKNNSGFFLQLYEPGDFVTHWKLRFSEDRCFVKFPGQANLTLLREFCPRVGGMPPGEKEEFALSLCFFFDD